MNSPYYDCDLSQPQNFTDNIFWDNRASNGNIIGNGSAAAPFELEGLGHVPMRAMAWYYDMGSSDGGKLKPMDSIVQTYDVFCPNGTIYGSFNLPPPFLCDDNDCDFECRLSERSQMGLQ